VGCEERVASVAPVEHVKAAKIKLEKFAQSSKSNLISFQPFHLSAYE